MQVDDRWAAFAVVVGVVYGWQQGSVQDKQYGCDSGSIVKDILKDYIIINLYTLYNLRVYRLYLLRNIIIYRYITTNLIKKYIQSNK